MRTDKIGAGGMGEVWKAWDTDLSRWVALKFLKGSDEEEVLRFKREAQTAGRLNHPNIAAIYEFGETQGRHWIAMQFIPGQTLKSFPRNNRRMLVMLIRDAARALQAATEEGIVHRDLKPENLMVVSKQKPATDRIQKHRSAEHHLYVMDFGLARAADGASDLSVSGLIVGTPAYMSPEQARGERVDSRADIWSLGATLYELLTDRKPFEGKNAIQTLRDVQDREPKPPRSIDPKIDADIETIVLKCLEKDRTRRYATADDLAGDLDHWLAGEPIGARPIPALVKGIRKIRRNKVISGAIALVLLVAMVSAIVLVSQKRKSTADLTAAEVRRIESEDQLKRLSQLWMEIIEKKRDLRSLKVPVEKARPALLSAVTEVEKFVRAHPDLPQAWYLKARGELYMNHHALALVSATKAVDLDPGFGPGFALRGLIALETAIGLSTSDTARERTANLIRQEDLISRASADFGRANKAGSGKDAALNWGLPRISEDDVSDVLVKALGLHFMKSETAKAVDLLQEAAKNRNAEEYGVWLCQLCSGETARDWIVRTTKWAPGYAWAWFLAGVNHPRSDPGGVIANCTEAIRLDPGLSTAWTLRGMTRQKMGDIDGAIQDFDEAIRLDPTVAGAWGNRGHARLAKGAYDGAIADCDEAIKLDSKLAYAFGNRGIARRAKGDFRGAITDCDEGIRLDPLLVGAWINRARARQSLGELDSAVKDMDEGIRLSPTNPDNWAIRGAILETKGDLEGAIRDYTEALSRMTADSPNRARLDRHIQGIRAKLGK